MSSIVSGFEYDIFISYRHNDNRSGWVTEFVNALQEELASTIKDPLSSYFDKNPHDGLLETHSVDKSLEGKLKCLIFIPIISQTYCDPKSFAWQNEFVAFNKLSKEDQFGRDIRLSNGNVTSRILPVKIHDLDADDKASIEKEIGGMLRAIEFIFKTSGVNRPLTPSDKKEDNSNKTLYRDQINKAANAIKEIIAAIKSSSRQTLTTINDQPTTKPARSRKPIFISIVGLLVVTFGYFIYHQRTTYNEPSTVDKSIAVLPFADLSEKKDQEYFSDGLTEELLDLLTRQKSLRVIGRTSSFAFKGKNEDLRTIGEKLGVNYLLEGSLRKSGEQLRIKARLINAKNGSHLWSETFERDAKDVFGIYDEIAAAIVTKLNLSFSTASYAKKSRPDVYDLILQAKYQLSRHDEGSVPKVKMLWEQANDMDSTDARVLAGLSMVYRGMAWQKDSLQTENVNKAYELARKAVFYDEELAEARLALAEVLRVMWAWNESLQETQKAMQLSADAASTQIYLSIGQLNKQLELNLASAQRDPAEALSWRNLSVVYYNLNNWSEAKRCAEKALQISPQYQEQVNNLGLISILNGRYREALEKFEKTHDHMGLAIVYWLSGDKKKSDECIRAMSRNRGYRFRLARAYAMRGELDKSFESLELAYRQKSIFFVFLKTDPLLANLRKDQRYVALLKKLNLPLN